jgi:hypothetical protein
MEIRASGSTASRRAPADYFSGAVWQDPVVEAPSPGNVRASLVHFEPGARTAWHTHPAGQTLYILSGVGRVIDGYDPRIHTLYFCPQLYKHDEHNRLVPLEGEEIGRLLAKALEGKVKLRLPWYEPTHKLPADPIIAGDLNKEFDTLVIDEPPDRPRLVASTGREVAAG